MFLKSKIRTTPDNILTYCYTENSTTLECKFVRACPGEVELLSIKSDVMALTPRRANALVLARRQTSSINHFDVIYNFNLVLTDRTRKSISASAHIRLDTLTPVETFMFAYSYKI